MLSIDKGVVKSLGDVPMEQEAAAVVISTNGKRAFVCLNLAQKIGVLDIDGQKVTYDKSLDIPSAVNPYDIDITPDGKYVIVANTGAQKNNADAVVVVIDATGPHPHVIDIMTPGNGPEGLAISPNGKSVAASLLLGSGAKESDWFKTKDGELVVMSIRPNRALTITGKAPPGALPEGISYSPHSEYVYLGNYLDKDLQVFQLVNGKPVQVSLNIKLPGQPASMRGMAR
jgi:Lactonase, 7-bladed beta-propeller